jgi:hypothetical protein
LNSQREIGKKQGGYNGPCVVSVKQPIDAPAPNRRTLEGLVNAQGWGRACPCEGNETSRCSCRLGCILVRGNVDRCGSCGSDSAAQLNSVFHSPKFRQKRPPSFLIPIESNVLGKRRRESERARVQRSQSMAGALGWLGRLVTGQTLFESGDSAP